MEKFMNADDLAMFSEVVWKRMAQLLNSAVRQREQEWNRFFLWIMTKMLEIVERAYPHEGRNVVPFKVEEKGARCVEVSCERCKDYFRFLPGIEASEALDVISEVVNFIEVLDGYEIINRFPKDNRKRVDNFQVVVDYSKKKKK